MAPGLFNHPRATVSGERAPNRRHIEVFVWPTFSGLIFSALLDVQELEEHPVVLVGRYRQRHIVDSSLGSAPILTCPRGP